MEKNRVCGGKCYESLASYDRESSSWKMSQLSFFEEDAKSLDRLPKSGIAQNGQLYLLEIKELRISGNDGSLLPTPTAQEPGKVEIDKSKIDPKKGVNQRFYTKKGVHTQKSIMRLIQWEILPTPTATNAKHNPCTPSRHTGKHVKCINTVIGQTEEAKTIGKEARLNPRFVEWMMGFPSGWLD